MGNGDFRVQRERSLVYEKAFALYLQRRGYYILPTYDYTGLKDDKAPRLKGENQSLVVPDLLAAKNGLFSWFEIKLKQQADLYRKTNVLETGLALRHWKHYQEVKRLTGTLVNIIFIHEKEQEIRCGELSILEKYHSHTYKGDRMDRGGTIFFAYERLPRVGTFADLLVCARQIQSTKETT